MPAIEVNDMKKIAIVGAGIGGTSCAHFLNELLGKKRATIHVYEPNRVGGRLSVVTLNGTNFEAGGSIIHPRNKYMKEFVDIFDLKSETTMTDELVGLYDGKDFKFVESKHKIFTTLKLFWRYGWDLLRLNYYLHNLLDTFDSIYSTQSNRQCFKNVSELLGSMNQDFPVYLGRSIKHGLIGYENCHEKVVDEMVLAANMVNYGQDNSIHQFVGSVSLAGGMDELWAVKGGNYQVAERLLMSSGAELHKYAVEKIELFDKKFKLFTKHGYDIYDTVILATPIVENVRLPIEFVNFPKPINITGTYHRTVTTFVEGVINYKYFQYDKPEDVPGAIFSINETNFFNSISLLKYDVTHSVYKVFSKEPLSDSQLGLLFDFCHNVQVVDWLAYPNYSTESRYDSFVLHNNLYYVNAIEWAASAMEMSVIGAKNVALLVYHDYVKPKPVNLVRSDL